MKRRCFISLFLVILLLVNIKCSQTANTGDSRTTSVNTTIKLLDAVIFVFYAGEVDNTKTEISNVYPKE